MKPRTNHFDSTLHGVHQPKPTGTPYTTATVTSGANWDDLSCGAVIRGNHRTPNPWNYVVARRWSDNLSATAEDAGLRSSWTGHYTKIPEGLYEIFNDELNTVRAAAASRLLEQVRGGLDVSIDLAQFKKTVATPHDIKKAIRGCYQSIAASGVRKLTAPIKAAGNAWLLFQYGVKPTLGTIHDSIDQLRNHCNSGFKHYTARASRATPYTKSVPNWPDSAFWSAQYTGKARFNAVYGATLRSQGDTLEQAARWSSLNPVSIAWELMPWSFVVDWFVNVGGYLREQETSLVFNNYFINGYTTYSYAIESTISSSRNVTNSSGTFTGNYKAYGFDRGMQRSLTSGLPSPPLPKVKPELGSGRLLNAAALLSTFLR
jgi:hypothetical protein